MKKIIFAMMAAGVFTLSSCSGDDLSGVSGFSRWAHVVSE